MPGNPAKSQIKRMVAIFIMAGVMVSSVNSLNLAKKILNFIFSRASLDLSEIENIHYYFSSICVHCELREIKRKESFTRPLPLVARVHRDHREISIATL